jgi:filamentous hemagglutinin family protein
MNIFNIIFRFSFGFTGVLLFVGIRCGAVWAQIVPDNTLGSESSTLGPSTLQSNPNLPVLPITLIQGGALRDNYLFHSFSDFNVNSQERVYFANPEGVKTTFARITGRAMSNINGVLGIDGTSSLVIINPNGITFGPSVRLFLNSSFTATTTKSVGFRNDYIFSAVEPELIPVIQFNVPFGIQLSQVSPDVQVDARRGDIIVQGVSGLGGQSYGLTFFSEGNIDTSQALIGDRIYNVVDRNREKLGGISKNDILFEANGNIKTGNVFSTNTITMISHESFIDTTSGRLLTLVSPSVSDHTNRGNITLKAKDKIISGTIDAGGINSAARSDEIISISGTIDAGGVNIDADGVNSAGTVNSDFFRRFKDQRNLNGDPPYPRELDIYRSGNIEITAPYIDIVAGAKVSTSNRGINSGNSIASGVVPGVIVVRASERLTINGVGNKENVGGLFSESFGGSFTLPGRIEVSTGELLVDNSGSISVKSASEVQMDKTQMALTNRANIKIEANSVILQNGGNITTSTSRFSNSGSIEINAKDSISLSGKGSGLFANTGASSSGIGGDIRINPNSITPGTLIITDGAGINLNSSGSGMGGNLDIHVKSLTLNNNAFLSSETSRANGGSLNLTVDQTLLMRNSSRISTSAGTAADANAIGRGGDLNINAKFIVAPPYENSDIKANAFNGNGGAVNINTQRAFGIKTRSRDDLIRILKTTDPSQLDPIRLSTSEVTAISQNNATLNGSIALAELNIDPAKGLDGEPLTPSTPSVSEDCSTQPQSQGSRIINSGQGGITPMPTDSLAPSNIWQETSTRPTQGISPPETILPIAQGWSRKDDQTVILTGQTTPKSSTVACHAN